MRTRDEPRDGGQSQESEWGRLHRHRLFLLRWLQHSMDFEQEEGMSHYTLDRQGLGRLRSKGKDRCCICDKPFKVGQKIEGRNNYLGVMQFWPRHSDCMARDSQPILFNRNRSGDKA